MYVLNTKETQCIAAFETHLLTEKRVAHNTFLAYKQDIDQFIQFLHASDQTVDSCTKTHLKHFLKKLKKEGLKARTLSRKISSLKLLYSFLSEHYQIHNHAESLISPKLEKNLPNFLTESEIESLFKVVNNDESPRGIRNKVMLSMLYASGMRISELLSLEAQHINFETGFVSVFGKGNKERFIPLPQNVLSLVRYYFDDVYFKLLGTSENTQEIKHLFVSFYGKKVKPMTRQACWVLLKKLLLKAHIDKNFSPHTLRHSLATHLLKNGADLRSLQLILGHEQLGTVEIYTHLQTGELRKIYDKKHPRS